MMGVLSNTLNLILKIPQNVRRKIIQIAAFGFTNLHLENFATGSLYTGKWKEFCAPGLNCYSCPAARFSCPIGAIQTIGNSRSFGFSFYAIGIILAFGVVLGRAVCGFLCPFGLIQEVIHLIPVPKLRLKKIFKYLKYVVLGILVILLPVAIADMTGLGKPWFCEYVCPAGTLEAGIALIAANPLLRDTIGWLFWLKVGILAATVVLSAFIYRFFCKALCPLGAIYGLLNRISLYHVSCDKEKCTKCGACKKACKMDVDPSKEIRSPECILCGKCTGACSHGALKMSWKLKDASETAAEKEATVKKLS